MGYVNNAETVAGKNIVAPIFVTVGQNTIALSSIRLTKEDGSDCTTGANAFNTITDQGAVGVQYTWTSYGRNASKRWNWSCNNVEITSENDIYLPQGASLVFSAEAAGVTIKTSGEVQISDSWTFSNSVAGKNLIANPYATVQKLSKIRLTKADGSDCTTGANALNTITDQGAVGVQYTWTSYGRNASKRWNWSCNNVEITDANDIDIPAGAGLVFSSEADGVKMTFNQK